MNMPADWTLSVPSEIRASVPSFRFATDEECDEIVARGAALLDHHFDGDRTWRQSIKANATHLNLNSGYHCILGILWRIETDSQYAPYNFFNGSRAIIKKLGRDHTNFDVLQWFVETHGFGEYTRYDVHYSNKSLREAWIRACAT